jgi:hypothetical protein
LNALAHLDTPAALIDLSRMQANIERMQARMNTLGVAFRPHVKTSKCTPVARAQQAAGARGITVSTLKEASAFFADGFTDILYAVGMVPAKLPQEGRKPPVEGISTRPTDSSGRRMTNAELGLTGPAKKPVKKAMGGSVSNPPVRPVVNPNPPTKGPTPKTRTPIKPGQPKPVPHPTVINPKRPTPMPPPARPMGAEPKPSRISTPEPKLSTADRVTRAMANSPEGVVVKAPMMKSKGGSAKKGVPAHSSKPMIGRKSGGLSVMPKGKC